jgi:histidinol phosphatase-like enzyme (inositol monophosphatase family)
MAETQRETSDRARLALDLAREAESIILPFYQAQELKVESKRDSSPVTAADRHAEEFLRERIARAFPDDAILGEEFGETSGSSGFRWILDPVDGTKSFVHGVPLFGTLVGIEDRGTCVAGVCHFPALRETVWGERGAGAFWQLAGNGARPARVSTISAWPQALCCFTTVQGFARVGRAAVFEALVANAGLVRGWGDCYGHALVATGRAELMVDPLMSPWDAAALLPILHEAGGAFFDWNGQPTIHGGNGISVNAALREAVLEIARR